MGNAPRRARDQSTARLLWQIGLLPSPLRLTTNVCTLAMPSVELRDPSARVLSVPKRSPRSRFPAYGWRCRRAPEMPRTRASPRFRAFSRANTGTVCSHCRSYTSIGNPSQAPSKSARLRARCLVLSPGAAMRRRSSAGANPLRRDVVRRGAQERITKRLRALAVPPPPAWKQRSRGSPAN